MTKQDVLRVVQSLPDDVSIEEVIEELRFRAKVEERLGELDHAKPSMISTRPVAMWDRAEKQALVHLPTE